MSRPDGIRGFVASTLATLTGMLAILGVGLIPRRPTLAATPSTSMPPIAPRAMHFLMVLTAVPPLTLIAGALLTQNGLKAAWASSMFNLAGLLAVALAGERFDSGALKRIGAVALFLLLLLPSAYGIAAAVPFSPAKPQRVQWPGSEIAERMGDIWHRATHGAPLRIVAGDPWIAGLVSLSHKDQPQLLSNADIRYSPWISAAQIEADGMLVLWQHEKSSIALKLMPFIAPRLAEARVEGFKSRYSHKEIEISYIIVPPKSSPR